MDLIASLFILLTAIIHCLFFKLESIDFMKEKILKKFSLTTSEGSIVKIWAFNQGFYNLFLALGLFFSIYLLHGHQRESGKMLASFILLTIIGAGLVLFSSSPKKYPVAILQALPALLGFIAVINL